MQVSLRHTRDSGDCSWVRSNLVMNDFIKLWEMTQSVSCRQCKSNQIEHIFMNIKIDQPDQDCKRLSRKFEKNPSLKQYYKTSESLSRKTWLWFLKQDDKTRTAKAKAGKAEGKLQNQGWESQSSKTWLVSQTFWILTMVIWPSATLLGSGKPWKVEYLVKHVCSKCACPIYVCCLTSTVMRCAGIFDP